MKGRISCSEYSVRLGGVSMRIAVAADLHNSDWDDIIAVIAGAEPDIIAVPGDLCGSLARCSEPQGEVTGRYIEEARSNEIGFAFLAAAVKIAPVYGSVGNHEAEVSEENRRRYAATGAVLLDNSYVTLGNVKLGGVSTGGAHGLWHKSNPPDVKWIESFSRLDGVKILLSHHPEYWERHIRGLGIGLTISGHAHGGQWRAFGRGLFAPGQGLFPKYTSGVHRYGDEYLVVSRGLRKECGVPRINNPPQVVIINIRDSVNE